MHFVVLSSCVFFDMVYDLFCWMFCSEMVFVLQVDSASKQPSHLKDLRPSLDECPLWKQRHPDGDPWRFLGSFCDVFWL